MDAHEDRLVASLSFLRDGELVCARPMFVMAVDPRIVSDCFEALGVRTARAGEVLMVSRDEEAAIPRSLPRLAGGKSDPPPL